jgi:diguanylate cyclase (GGDEF)-like protein
LSNRVTIKLLVVDDDDDDLYLINEALAEVSGTHYNVVTATSALQAMAILSKNSFDVILSDYRLGPVTGIDFIQSLRKAGNETPVVLLTGMPDKTVDAAALKAGASDFVPKIAITADVLDRTVRYAMAHAERQQLLNAVLRSSSSGVAVMDRDGLLSLWNPRFANLAATAFDQAADALSQLADFVLANTAGDASLGDRIVEAQVSPLQDGGRILTLHDVTERVNVLRERELAEKQVRKVAMQDGLTGLPNRMAFNHYLDYCIESALAVGTKVAVMSFDFNKFKEVNDLFGHAAGDMLLKVTATRLQALMLDNEYAARLGGDEFVLVQTEATSETAADLSRRVFEKLCVPITFDDKSIDARVSVGVAFCPEHGDDRETILANADLAMYRAKSEDTGLVCVFGASIDSYVRERRKVANDLKAAIQNGELELYFQPQFSAGNCEYSGAEALLRWNSPTRGTVSPADFIPVAEEYGLIHAIDEWVLREACKFAAQRPTMKRIAVNISAKGIGLTSIAATVRSIITQTGLSPTRLELEITETALIQDLNRALHSLRQIKSLGISIAMDDFGTGYSSLSLLNAFPFDRIKIDKSFVQAADNNPRAGAIFKSVIGLGAALQVPVLVEGVETVEQFALAQSAGCEEIQGYFMARPMSMEALDAITKAAPKPLLAANFRTKVVTLKHLTLLRSA